MQLQFDRAVQSRQRLRRYGRIAVGPAEDVVLLEGVEAVAKPRIIGLQETQVSAPAQFDAPDGDTEAARVARQAKLRR